MEDNGGTHLSSIARQLVPNEHVLLLLLRLVSAAFLAEALASRDLMAAICSESRSGTISMVGSGKPKKVA